ncbi:gluconolactonase [Sphingomonas sp. GB1N7]|uniref:gluconolactonase n=1 Tax=Parasphingomonas caseinilytica TaxID=3096158 RepID=UPI002FC78584
MPGRSLVMLALLAAAPAPLPTYRVATTIAGPDGAGWDYASVDADARQLYVAHGDAVTTVAFDGSVEATSIGAINHGHAVVPIPHSHVLLVTSGRDSTVRLIDTASGAERARLSVGEDPDAAILDPVTGHVLVMNAKAGTISEIDAAKAAVVRTIKVKPALEFAAIGRGRILFVNNEDSNEIDTVDLAAGRMRAPIALPGCEAPTGLAYDARTDRLIAACANGKAAIVDATRRRLVSLVAIGGGPDAVILDADRRLAFIPCGKDGVLEMLSLDAPGGVARIASIRTEVGARTGALDPKTGAIYLPTARFGPLMPGAKRAPALPGTFHILVVRPARAA